MSYKEFTLDVVKRLWRNVKRHVDNRLDEDVFPYIDEEIANSSAKTKEYIDSGKHNHLWERIIDRPFGYFPTGKGIGTVVSDDALYDGYHKVSDFIPTYQDIKNGGSISYYKVTDGELDGGLISINFPQADYTVSEVDNGVLIKYDGVPLVLISYNGSSSFGAVNYIDVTEPGVYFQQNSYRCVHSLTINGYTGFKEIELKTIGKEFLPNDIGAVKTVNYIKPDENGNINIENGGGSGISDKAFEIVKSGTLLWDGDTTGKVTVTNAANAGDGITFVHMSDSVLTMEDLANGGRIVWSDGYEEDFTAEVVEDGGNYILGNYTSFFVIKEDNVNYAADSDFNLTFPKKGIYLLHIVEDGNESYITELSVNGYSGFTKPMLREECMPDITKKYDWYGKLSETSGNTVLSDDIVYGRYVKVSDAVPTEEELRKGGTIRHYNVENNQLSGDLIVGDYLGDDYGIAVREEAIAITYGLELLVIVSINGSPNVGPLIIDTIDSPGVYFAQNGYSVTHSWTIDEYTGFDSNISPIPAELMPVDYIKQLISEVVGS